MQWFSKVLIMATMLGLGLRLWQYDRVPGWHETADEVMYAWAGMTWLQTGVPTSWSGVLGYETLEQREYWGDIYTFVTPWVHKPLLYPLLSGGLLVLTGTRELDEVRLTTLRLLPIVLGTCSIILVGLLGRKLFDPLTGASAALLYATVPTVVITNRLSVIESALTPVMLLAALGLLHFQSGNRRALLWLALASAAAVLLKQTGLVVGLVAGAELIRRRNFRAAALVILAALAAVGVYLAGSAYYVGPARLLTILVSFADKQTEGAPQFMAALWRYPAITNRASLLIDPWMLLGYVAFFAWPWLKHKTASAIVFPGLPLVYLALFILLESGNRYFFAWHLYPLFPFVLLAAAAVVRRTFEEQQFAQLAALAVFFSLCIGQVAVIAPIFLGRWQAGMAVLFAAPALLWWLWPTGRRQLLAGLFLVLLCGNIAVVFNQTKFLKPNLQPPNTAQP